MWNHKAFINQKLDLKILQEYKADVIGHQAFPRCCLKWSFNIDLGIVAFASIDRLGSDSDIGGGNRMEPWRSDDGGVVFSA